MFPQIWHRPIIPSGFVGLTVFIGFAFTVPMGASSKVNNDGFVPSRSNQHTVIGKVLIRRMSPSFTSDEAFFLSPSDATTD